MNEFYETEDVCRFTNLEIQTATDRESAAPLRITESPEVGRVHVQIEEERVVLCVPIRVIAEIGMVQHVDRIDSDFKLFSFRNPHALDQVHVQRQMPRSLDPSQPKIADLSGSRIHEKKPALGVRYRLVAELSVESVE